MISKFRLELVESLYSEYQLRIPAGCVALFGIQPSPPAPCQADDDMGCREIMQSKVEVYLVRDAEGEVLHLPKVEISSTKPRDLLLEIQRGRHGG